MSASVSYRLIFSAVPACCSIRLTSCGLAPIRRRRTGPRAASGRSAPRRTRQRTGPSARAPRRVRRRAAATPSSRFAILARPNGAADSWLRPPIKRSRDASTDGVVTEHACVHLLQRRRRRRAELVAQQAAQAPRRRAGPLRCCPVTRAPPSAPHTRSRGREKGQSGSVRRARLRRAPIHQGRGLGVGRCTPEPSPGSRAPRVGFPQSSHRHRLRGSGAGSRCRQRASGRSPRTSRAPRSAPRLDESRPARPRRRLWARGPRSSRIWLRPSSAPPGSAFVASTAARKAPGPEPMEGLGARAPRRARTGSPPDRD